MINSKNAPIVGVLLAAGFGRRFGGDKLLHALPNGEPLALAAAGPLLAGCDEVVAVLRPAQTELAGLFVQRRIRVVISSDAELGMGHSLAAGVGAALDAHGWVVALADMPYIQAATVAHVVAALRAGASIVMPEYAGQRGHPVGFSHNWGAQLTELRGVVGARALLGRFPESIHQLPVDDPGIVFDIDTPGLAATLPNA